MRTLCPSPSSAWPLLLAALLTGCQQEPSSALRTPAAARPTVSLITTTNGTAQMKLTLPVTVVAFDHATLTAQVAGYLDHINVDIGSRVKKGEVLLLIRTPDLDAQRASALAALQAARATQSGSEAQALTQADQTRRLAQVAQTDSEFVAQQDLDTAQARTKMMTQAATGAASQVDAAQASFQRIAALQDFGIVRAPFAGVITTRSVDPGTLVRNDSNGGDGGTPLLTIDSLGSVRVILRVPDTQSAFIHVGQAVTVHLDALPGETFSGKVTRISGALDPTNRTMQAEVDLPNPAGKLRTGMFGSAMLDLRTEPGALFLPSSAIHQDRAGASFVYVVQNGSVHPQSIVTSLDNGIRAKVDGLQPGLELVLGSSGTLASGMQVDAHPATTAEMEGVR
jgi:RND family efflux transporter, MFP subunit